MITLLVLATCLFVFAFLFGRRFGLPVLGLSAGLVIGVYMSTTAVAVSAPYLKQYVSYVPPAIVVLPALLLLIFAKSRHRTVVPRLIGAAVFAAAGVVFVIAAPLTPTSISGSVPFVTNNLGGLITGFLILALLEAAFGKASKKKLDEGKKK